jgi:hypothetical protein
VWLLLPAEHHPIDKIFRPDESVKERQKDLYFFWPVRDVFVFVYSLEMSKGQRRSFRLFFFFSVELYADREQDRLRAGNSARDFPPLEIRVFRLCRRIGFLVRHSLCLSRLGQLQFMKRFVSNETVYLLARLF